MPVRHGSEDFDTLSTSPFTIPGQHHRARLQRRGVHLRLRSVVAGARLSGVCEVIVVNDGSRDGTLTELAMAFDLEVVEAKARPSLPASAIRGVYRSRSYPRLTVIDKVNGGKADALNCGINFARFRYICCVDTDTVYYPTALLKGMRLIVQDPATVVGVTSQVASAGTPERTAVSDRRIDRHPLIAYPDVRLSAGVRRRAARLERRELHAVFRRRICHLASRRGARAPGLLAVVHLRGYRVHLSCPPALPRNRDAARVHSLTDPVGVTGGAAEHPQSREPARRGGSGSSPRLSGPIAGCCATHDTEPWGAWGCRHYVAAEVLAPVFQLLAVIAVPVAAMAGVLRWDDLLRTLAILALGNGIFTSAAILLQERAFRTVFGARSPDYDRAGAAGTVSLPPFIMFAQVKGTIDFLFGDREWHKFERNRRETHVRATSAFHESGTAGANMKILILDAHAANRRAVRSFVQATGAEVTRSGCGR